MCGKVSVAIDEEQQIMRKEIANLANHSTPNELSIFLSANKIPFIFFSHHYRQDVRPLHIFCSNMKVALPVKWNMYCECLFNASPMMLVVLLLFIRLE